MLEHGAALFAGEDDGYIYTRIGNPTVHALEENIAQLEHGYGGIATSSGMAAVCTVYMALLETGAHIVSTASVYGPTRGLMENDFARFGVAINLRRHIRFGSSTRCTSPEHEVFVH